MTKTAAVLASLVAVLALFYSVTTPEVAPVEMPVNPWINAECTKTLELECAIDIERTIRACATAIETEGADIIADIKCARDLLADKKTCWPCICAEAKKKEWKILGC